MIGWTIYLRVNVGRSMETVSQPQAFRSKSLKYKDPVSSVPNSLGQQALRKIRFLEEVSAFWPRTRSTTPAAIQRPTMGYSSAAATRQENRWELGSGGGLETHIQRSPKSAR
jgi:hypothetical protein